MGCSVCGDADHNKARCPRAVTPNVTSESVSIQVDPIIQEKLKLLAHLCKCVAEELGKGHTEKIYQEALSLELQQKGVVHILEQVIPIMYKGIQLGGCHSMRIDICLQGYLDFIYELKATATMIKVSELWQILRYLKTKNYTYGAVVNFNQSLGGRLEIQFVVKNSGEYYLYDIKNASGVLLSDFVLDSAIDFSPCLIEDG